MRISDWSSDVCSSDLDAGLVDRLLHVGPQQIGLHRRALGAVDALDDAVLGIGGEAFVEPEIVPGRVGDEIARPAMRKLVRDHADQALVAGDDRGRREGESGALHAAVREAWRERSEEHTSERQSLMRISYADFC